LKRWIRKVAAGKKVSCRRLGSLIGCLNSLYLRTLHSALAAMVKLSEWNGWGITPRRVISEMQFWLSNIDYKTPYGFRLRPVQALLTTDASERGWGAVLVIGSMSDTTYGCFSMKYAYA
jgi:hypothetical protein